MIGQSLNYFCQAASYPPRGELLLPADYCIEQLQVNKIDILES
jgi:hypothetical protein